MTIEKEKERLSQSVILEKIKKDKRITEMSTVYLASHNDSHNYGFYCGLIPSDKIEESLSYPDWDIRYGDGYPGAILYQHKEETNTQYHRYGNDEGFEPLVIVREFHGLRQDYLEMSEEFRFFHRLYHDKKQDRYFKIDNSGTEQLVAIVEPQRVQIRLKEIRQFLAIKEMYLSIQFDCREHSQYSLEELGFDAGGEEKRNGMLNWGLYFGEGDGFTGYNSFSRLLGKRLISPLPKEKSGFWGYAEEEPKEYVEFIIGIDENGNEIKNTSDPDLLANNFGANPGSPFYLTPVFFRKEVLDKYYQQPSKYSVEDAILRCGYLWNMYLDNHHKDKVCAWLGDLGRDLPYKEQLHWRSHNIAPVGGLSETFFGRQIECQFLDSDRPEHVFNQQYHNLKDTCDDIMGWAILLPLTKEDEHHLQAIRIPSGEEQKDFDDLILALTKILIDSINEKEINKFISETIRDEINGSISRLEYIFQQYGMPRYKEQIKFLRNLQNLRSAGSAHRKGSNYRKIAKEIGVSNMSLARVFEGILIKANQFLQYLDSFVRSQKLINKTE